MNEMFFELLCITVILYLKNLFFEKMANPSERSVFVHFFIDVRHNDRSKIRHQVIGIEQLRQKNCSNIWG